MFSGTAMAEVPSQRSKRYIGSVKNEENATCQAVLDVAGAHCPACAFTIEKRGRRVPGVREVRVDVSRHEIRVEYDGAPGTLERIAAIVGTLGYSATVRNAEREDGAAGHRL
jgi:copper chaperone CopZ